MFVLQGQGVALLLYVLTILIIQLISSLDSELGSSELTPQEWTLQRKYEQKEARKLCKSLFKAHHVSPGISWGTLSTLQQELWMNNNCDRFFCQPNSKAGKGVYKCIPI
jgi:hypothetical protein